MERYDIIDFLRDLPQWFFFLVVVPGGVYILAHFIEKFW